MKTRPNISKLWKAFYKEYDYEDISVSMYRSLWIAACVNSKNGRWGNIFETNSYPGALFVGALNKNGKNQLIALYCIHVTKCFIARDNSYFGVYLQYKGHWM